MRTGARESPLPPPPTRLFFTLVCKPPLGAMRVGRPALMLAASSCCALWFALAVGLAIGVAVRGARSHDEDHDHLPLPLPRIRYALTSADEDRVYVGVLGVDDEIYVCRQTLTACAYCHAVEGAAPLPDGFALVSNMQSDDFAVFSCPWSQQVLVRRARRALRNKSR